MFPDTITDVRRVALVLSVALFALPLICSAKKKKPEEVTQVLAIPKDPPSAVVAEVQRLVFHVSPLSGKGLLSQQTRDALKNLLQQTRGAQIVKLRAFVAGSGDLRRVQTIVSETFTDKKMNLPALSVIQVGGLPLEGAQVVLESTSSDNKKLQNEQGLAFFSGQPSTMKDPVGPLQKMVQKAGLEGASVRRVTCFLSTLEGVNGVRGQLQTAFPKAAADFVQLERASLADTAECEAVAALKTAPARPMVLIEPEAGKYSQAAFVAPGKVALTGTQVGFRFQDEDVRLAFGRLGKALEGVGANFKSVAMTHIYPLSASTANRIRKIRFEFYDAAKPPASTLLLFEGLPGLDAAFGIDIVAVLP
jgi:enamine deaminase RidA (YjgF/YER057c/UK114 family)